MCSWFPLNNRSLAKADTLYPGKAELPTRESYRQNVGEDVGECAWADWVEEGNLITAQS